MRHAILVSLIVPALATPPAHAAERAPDPDYSAGDWIASFLIGNAAGTAGGFIGAGIGYGLAGECHEVDDDDSFFGPCAFHGLGEAAIGGLLGATFGGAAGIYAYGELTGHDGSYWAAAGGFAVGLLAAGGITALATEADAPALSVAAVFTLPALGGTLGYVLSLDDGGGSDRRYQGALIEVDEGRVYMGVPDVGLTLDEAGRFERADLRIMSGRF